MSRNHFVSGESNAICDRCGQKLKSGVMRTAWNGLFVCPPCFETRQPQDFVKARYDKITVPITRPRPNDAFIDVPYIDTGNTTIPSGNNNGEL